MYANLGIQKVINKVFFQHPKDEGIILSQYFDAPGIPIILIALVATAVKFSAYYYVIMILIGF